MNHDERDPTPESDVLQGALERAFGAHDDAPPPRFGGRYEPAEVIGRGGMGLVQRAHELRLERDIAVKTLRADLAADPRMVQRFLREARILASLDHPAIVAVHELGTTTDGLPYIAMRLIRGESLEAVLAARSDPTEDRSRLLLAFQGICQAIAHAHEQGVIHRDLKPANVMIGPHGEIQVVDWGLACRLDEVNGIGASPAREPRTPLSTAASPLGTPAYMAPEQARADREAVGTTTDVFGLGSILCEILTGGPPHRGTPIEALRTAIQAGSAEAIARLETSDAPDELRALAASCLADDPATRPPDAGAVSRAFGACLAQMDRDARQAQLDAVASQTQAQEERKRRRVTLMLSVVIVGLVLGGSAVWAQRHQERTAHRARVAEDLADALGGAARLRAQAEREVEDAEGAWQRALDAADRARTLAAGPEVTSAARERAEDEHARIVAGWRGAKAAADARRAHRTAMSALADARTLRLTDCSLRACNASYRSFLASRGIAFPLADRAAAATALADAPEAIRPLLVSALDEWCEVRAVSKAQDEPTVAALAAFASEVDPDPWRGALRAAVGAGNKDGVGRVLAAADPRKLSEASLALAALWITHLERDDEARHWYAIAQLRFPANPWIHHMAALEAAHDERHAEAVAAWRTALALKPEVPALWRGLASALVAVAPTEAIEVAQMAIDQDMRCSKLYIELGRAHAAVGKDDAALTAFEQAVSRARPRDAEALVHLGDFHANRGRAGDARRVYAEALARASGTVRARIGLAELHAAAGEFDLGIEQLTAARQCACRCLGPKVQARMARLDDLLSHADGGE